MKHRTVGLVWLALTLGGCSWEPLEQEGRAPVSVPTPTPTTLRSDPPPPAVARPADRSLRRGDEAAAMAERMIGTPYRWGGADLEGFDCSGLVQFSYAQVQLDVPRTTEQQRRISRSIPRHGLRKGDLVFFDIEGKANHVGVYLGADRFVHAPSRGKRVEIASLTQSYYATRYSGAGRPPGADTPQD